MARSWLISVNSTDGPESLENGLDGWRGNRHVPSIGNSLKIPAKVSKMLNLPVGSAESHTDGAEGLGRQKSKQPRILNDGNVLALMVTTMDS